MFLIIKHDFDTMENEIGSAKKSSIIGVLDSDSQSQVDGWIADHDKLLEKYDGWDNSKYPYYTFQPVEILHVDTVSEKKSYDASPKVKVEGPYILHQPTHYSYSKFYDYIMSEACDIFERVKDNVKKDGSEMNFYDFIKGITAESWAILACIDKLTEIGYIKCISKNGMTQDWKYKYCGPIQ